MAGASGLSPTARHIAAAVAAALPDGPVVVALSGGADSAVLAWAVTASGHPARALSVNHTLPGSAALMDAAGAIARVLSIDHTVIRVDQDGDSETTLRASRLDALEGALQPAESILTGHTRDDLAETVLGNVLRGTGTTGLSGIPSRRGRWIRPLLGIERVAIRKAAVELDLPFVDDPQNDDLTIRRNRLRHETIPALADAYNPNLFAALARLGAAAAADDEVLEARAAAVPIRRIDEGVMVPAASLQTLPTAVAARVARRAVRLAGGPHAGTSMDVEAVLGAATGERATIGGAVDVLREGPYVILVTAPTDSPAEMELPVEGMTRWGPWTFSASGPIPALGRFGATVTASGKLVVRAARPGDRIRFEGGSKPVTEAMAEAGVPVRVRERWPVVESDGTILWIAGVRAAPVSEGRRVTVRATRRRT